jgi:hypothetical protein
VPTIERGLKLHFRFDFVAIVGNVLCRLAVSFVPLRFGCCARCTLIEVARFCGDVRGAVFEHSRRPRLTRGTGDGQDGRFCDGDAPRNVQQHGTQRCGK